MMGAFDDNPRRLLARAFDETYGVDLSPQKGAQDLEFAAGLGASAPRRRVHRIDVDAEIGPVERSDLVSALAVKKVESLGDQRGNRSEPQRTLPSTGEDGIDRRVPLVPPHPMARLGQPKGVAPKAGRQVEDPIDPLSEGPHQRVPHPTHGLPTAGRPVPIGGPPIRRKVSPNAAASMLSGWTKIQRTLVFADKEGLFDIPDRALQTECPNELPRGDCGIDDDPCDTHRSARGLTARDGGLVPLLELGIHPPAPIPRSTPTPSAHPG